ncbi:Pterin-4-alpha-carbinolamine dehydratase 2, mitochondrial [Stylosanthes scabra]|uniref:4a-hydroxytetrahydrobiopterin dehydratase n=1 Tax=Stylosanthes scabra TaxID=79078 RepID=A0ABU6Q3J5_9FABA|nr:Pterin-4-alpha-carbinolamine dehydratase 2, mitochondrial [Stylosanthes scabra]
MAMACAPSHLQYLRRLHRFGFLHLPNHPLSRRNFWHPPPHHPFTAPNHRTFQSAVPKGLRDKKCVPCNLKELRPMTEDAAHTLMPQVSEWNLVKEDGIFKLKRTWKVKTFTKGLEFLKIVGDLAESEGHHPDLHLGGWNNVTIEIWTHAVGGLTENDFILAAKIDKLNVNDLLRRKPSD